MAIFHCRIRIGKRKNRGGNAISHLAYINADKIKDEEQGRTCNYLNKKNVAHTETLLPENAPNEYEDPQVLWNEVQKIEKHKKAQLYREFEIALPIEFNITQNIELARTMAQSLADEGMCVSFAVHNNDGNPHAHIMCTTRSLKKSGKWDDKKKKVYLDKTGNPTSYKDAARDKKGKPKYKTVSVTDWNDKKNIV